MHRSKIFSFSRTVFVLFKARLCILSHWTLSNEDTKSRGLSLVNPLSVCIHTRLRIHLCGLSDVEMARRYGRSLKCTRATSVRNLKLSCHPLAKLYGAFIMFPATVTRKLLGPRPGSPVKTGEINPSAEATAKSLFPPCSLVSRTALSFLFVHFISST